MARMTLSLLSSALEPEVSETENSEKVNRPAVRKVMKSGIPRLVPRSSPKMRK